MGLADLIFPDPWRYKGWSDEDVAQYAGLGNSGILGSGLGQHNLVRLN